MARTDKPAEGIGGGGGAGAKSFGPYATGGTQIMQPKGTNKVIKIDPEGNISSRPFVRREVSKGTQANHSVTQVDRKTGKAK